jgi:hypothetical protein
MSDIDHERRKFPRIPAQHALLVRQLGEGECEELAKTHGMSHGGLSFTSRESFSGGSLLEISITVGQNVLLATGRVAYELRRDDGQYDIGVEFLHITENDRKKLELILPDR